MRPSDYEAHARVRWLVILLVLLTIMCGQLFAPRQAEADTLHVTYLPLVVPVQPQIGEPATTYDLPADWTLHCFEDGSGYAAAPGYDPYTEDDGFFDLSNVIVFHNTDPQSPCYIQETHGY